MKTARMLVIVGVAVGVVLAVLARPAGGTTYYVDPNGSDGANGLTWATAFATIGKGITSSSGGDVVEVNEGTYNEAINFSGKGITLRSTDPNNPNVVAATVIDANGLGSSVVTCSNSEGPDTILEGFTITGGDAYNGGGMYNYYSSPTVTNCTFSENSASNVGGGMLNYYSSPTVTNCTFTGNTAVSNGGGMRNDNNSPTVTNCTFTGNTADYGGGMFNNDSSPTVTNCTFTGNWAVAAGGMANWYYCSPTVTNCTFTGNSASNHGGGIDNLFHSSPTVTNCILWNNTPDEIFNDEISSQTVTYSDVQGGHAGTGNIDADPLFVDPNGLDGMIGTPDDNPRLAPGSPCIDAGDNNSVPADTADLDGDGNTAEAIPYDLAGNPRVAFGVVDMGAYELQTKDIHNITEDGYYETIQAAINDANDGDEIEVGPGTYYEAIDFGGKGVRLYSSGGAGVTTIDANGAYHAVQCVSGEDANTILEGFTITGGNANGSGTDAYGGGMYNYTSNPTVTNCTFSGNFAVYYGGGMYCYSSSPTVTNCTFSNNESESFGGGMYNYNGSPTLNHCSFSQNTSASNGGGMWSGTSSSTITDCSFSGNISTGNGGGMFNEAGSLKVTNCTFVSNQAGGSGGGMRNYNSSPTVVNCTFADNLAASGGGMINATNSKPKVINCTFSGNQAVSSSGGGMYNGGNCDPNVTNCTFSGNSASSDGGGMYNNNCSPTVTNCILWSNSPDEIYNNSSSPIVSYSDVEGGTGQSWFGTGCIDADPCFADPCNGDYHLQSAAGRWDPNSESWVTDANTSVCIDAGDPNSDWTEELWPHGGRINMGAYGGTPQASMSLSSFGNVADFNCDLVVDGGDLGMFVDMWLLEDVLLKEDTNRDGLVNLLDYEDVAHNWLQ
ncbi:MAG: right-handed parallel beta-helix repeat-containing protein [Planctomycetota bacterium]|nr:MAG: right-handed parallel beta-helix repeat-containing protein [Planctomycetota bacterium]